MTDEISWHLERRSIDALKSHPKNPRFIREDDLEHLKISISKFGLIDKPIINPDGMIIGGHQRINALTGLADTEVECWVPDRALYEDEVEELNIRLNRNTGEWDWDKLANEFDIEDLLNWGFREEEMGIDMKLPIEEEKEESECEICPSCNQKIKK